MATRPSEEGLGFEHTGWRAISIFNPDQPPSAWQLEWLATPENPYGLIVSGGVIQVEDYVYAFSLREPDHTVHLVRWHVASFLEGDLSQPEWWAGEEQGWVLQRNLVQVPTVLFVDGHTEFTVHHEPELNQFLEIQTVGFGQADLGFRLADAPTGQWTSLERFYRPEECAIPGILIYAAKAHPHLEGADLVLTYATNLLDFGRLATDDSRYYPRFLRASLKEGDG